MASNSKIDDGVSAFPLSCEEIQGEVVDGYGDPIRNGMTLRDYFAAQALAGMLAVPGSQIHPESRIAFYCYTYADAMIAARKVKP